MLYNRIARSQSCNPQIDEDLCDVLVPARHCIAILGTLRAANMIFGFQSRLLKISRMMRELGVFPWNIRLCVHPCCCFIPFPATWKQACFLCHATLGSAGHTLLKIVHFTRHRCRAGPDRQNVFWLFELPYFLLDGFNARLDVKAITLHYGETVDATTANDGHVITNTST